MASGQSRDEGDHLAHHHRQHHHNQYPCQFQNHLNTKQAHYQKQDESQDQKTFSITDGISVIIITITITITIISISIIIIIFNN
jgi:ABC-type nickel/cobalt efflux system permease component RcnA